MEESHVFGDHLSDQSLLRSIQNTHIRIAPFEVYAIHSILSMMSYSTDRVIYNTQRDCGTLHVYS